MAGESCLSDYSVLVVEDDFYLADELRVELEGVGATVLGPFGNPEAALHILDRIRPDCAVVDMNFGEGPSFKVPRALTVGAIPFVITTGYDALHIPPEFAHAPRIEKPVEPRRLVEAVAELCREAKRRLDPHCAPR
jgi:DNA-binding LytR/AlgR family response regulator